MLIDLAFHDEKLEFIERDKGFIIRIIILIGEDGTIPSLPTECWSIRLIKVAATQDMTTLYYINSYMGSSKHCKVKSPTWLVTT